MAVTLQDQHFALTEGLDAVAELVVVCLDLAFEHDLAIALEAGLVLVLHVLVVVPVGLWYRVRMDAFRHHLLLQVR